MLLEGKFTLEVPIQKAWDFLLEPETLASCVPGCEKWEAIDEKTHNSIVAGKVGPISARFKFTTTFTEVAPPTFLKAVGRGEDIGPAKGGNFSQETIVNLKEISEDEVEVSYRSDVMIVGKLATFGDRVMRAKAKEVEEELTQALKKRLSGESASVSKLEVSTWEMIAAFFALLWERIKKIFKGGQK